MSKLNNRQMDILRAIVESYIKTAEPVGSRTLSKLESFNISPATIRNEMSDLESLGLIIQPYTSSGRIPSEAGLRYYVDNLLDIQRLKEEEEDNFKTLRKSMSEKKAFIKSILHEYSMVLSKLSNYPGLLLLAGDNELSFRKIQFLKIDEENILVTLISTAGTVSNYYINPSKTFTQEELNDISRNFNNLKNCFSIEEINVKLVELLDTNIVVENPEDSLYNGSLFIEGMKNMFQHKEFSLEPDKMRGFLELMETKKAIAKILYEFLEVSDIIPTVKFGRELKGLEEMGICVAGVPLIKSSNPVGALGIIGPMRMEYGRVLALLEFFNKSFDNIYRSKVGE